MKGHKGEGVKQNQAKGTTLGGADRGPLFPRLHVNETEKAGPKAPPRNKMALYEQFTVPSHRLAQGSQTPTNNLVCQQQYGMREFGYPYVPYYMPSVPYAHTNHGVPMYAHPSHNTSSSGVTNSNGGVNEEPGGWAAPRHNRASKSSVSRHSTETSGNCSAKNLPEPKGKGAILRSKSSLTNQTEEATSSLQNVPSDMERPHITDIAERLQEALRTAEVTTECTVPDATRSGFPRVGCFIDKSTNSSVAHEGKRKQATQLSIFETMTKPAMGDASDTASVQVCWARESARHEIVNGPGMLASTPYVHGNMQSGASVDLGDKGTVNAGSQIFLRFEKQADPQSAPTSNGILENNECKRSMKNSPANVEKLEASVDLGDKGTVNAGSQGFMRFEKQATLDPQSAPTSNGILENNVCKRSMKNSPANVEKLENRTDAYSKQSLECSDGRHDNGYNRHSEVSQPSECGAHKEGHSDGVIVRSTSLDAIKPKDVIRAIGQQQFWKARKKLLRQQRIFSDQVFQLHKLIKVQQLLAETPGTLIDEEMQFELREEECYATTPSSNTATTYSGDDANKGDFDIKEHSKGKPLQPEGQPKSYLGQTQQADGNAGLGLNKSMPESNPVGVSTWGYPSLGAWGGAMAAQGGPFSYQPFGTAAFGLPFGQSMLRSGAPMMSFGIPFCDRRQEPPAEVDSNYGPLSALKHEGSGTLSVNSNHVSNDLAASWYFAQYNNLSNVRLLAGGSGRDVPTGSGASVNKSSANPQAAKKSCFPGLSQNWGLNSRTGPSNSNRQDMSAHQSENSSPSNASRPNGHTSSTPSTPPARWCGIIPRNTERQAEMVECSSTHTVNNSLDNNDGKNLEKEKLRPLSHSKPRTEEAVGMSSVDCPLSSSIGHNQLLDMNHSALDLFPLVPSMSSSRERVWNATTEGQGGVIRAVPRHATAASKSTAGILLSLQQERQK